MAKRSKADVKHAIDLLWSHQIRRENAALHKEVQELRGELVSHGDELKELHTTCEKASAAAESAIASVQRVQVEQDSLRTAVETVLRDGKNTAKKVTTLADSLQKARIGQDQGITEFGKDVEQFRVELAQFKEQHESDVRDFMGAATDMRLKIDSKCAGSELAGLGLRVDEIEAAVFQRQQMQSVSRIEDSIDEQARGRRGQDAFFPIEDSALRTAHGTSRLVSLSEQQDDAEVLLTLRDPISRGGSSNAEDFDLDQNVATMSYARNLRREVLFAESLTMLSHHDSCNVPDRDSQFLQQGRFHSWDRYFAEGQALVKKVSRRYESDVVKKFVEGLYASKQREQCEEWLDLNGWTWESIAAFGLSGTPSGPVHAVNDISRSKRTAPVKDGKATSSRAEGEGEAAFRKKPKKMQKRRENGGDLKVESVPVQRRSQRLVEREAVRQRPRKSQSQRKSNAITDKKILAKQQLTRVGWQRPRDASGRFQRLDGEASTRGETQMDRELPDPAPTPGVPKTRAKPKNDDPQLAEKTESQARAVPPVVDSKGIADTASVRDVSRSRPEPPTTPARQKTPNQDHNQTIPRLVKRKRSASGILGEGSKKVRHLIDEGGLPPIVPADEGKHRRRKKRKRLPLPPPPEIPILPTSD